MFVMKPEVFDAIDLVSESQGGLNRASMYDDDDTPRCMVGAAHFAGVLEGSEGCLYTASIQAVKDGILPSYEAFDDAHERLAPDDCNTRLPWPVVAAEMGVVRGDV